MATIVEEFVAVLEWDVDEEGIKTFNKNLTQVTDIAKKAATAIAGITAAATGFAVVTNKQTAINANLAASVGMSAESYEAWAGLMKQIGFDGERVVAMQEELNNRLGELKGLGEFITAEESLQMLGIRFKEIRDLAPEEQFLKILSTAKEMEDHQKAVSAVDMMFGGEANRVLGFLRTMDGDLEDILKRRMQLNLLDREARDNAIKFTQVWSDFEALLASIGAQFSGVLGEVITPFVNQFIDWAVANRELIKSNIRGFVQGIASIIKLTVPWIKSFVEQISKAVEALGGFQSVLRLIGFTFAAFSVIKIVTGIMAFTKAVQTATVAQTLLNLSVAAIPALIALAAIALGLIAEDIYQFLTGGESVTEKVVDSVTGMWREAVPIVEGYITDAVEFWASALGTNKENVDKFLIGIEEGFKKTFSFITDIYNNAIRDFETFIAKSVGLLKKIPLVGNLFAGLPSLGLTETFNAAPTPTAAAAAAGGNRSVTINSDFNMSVPPGTSPQDTQFMQTKVKEYWEEEVSKASRALSTGIEY
jgi:hypothetical protein